MASALDHVSTYSKPSDLRITDLRLAVVASNYDYPLLRIDTNQDVYGIGEVRDAGHKEDALRFKSILLGRDPTDVDQIFDLISRYGGQGREGGGVSGIEMALWDLTGKIYGVPAYQFLGGKYRDRIRLYGDTPEPKAATPESYVERAIERKAMGLTFIKFDMGVNVFDKAGVRGAMSGGRVTGRGLEYFRAIVAAVREAVGPEMPLAIDHFGPLDVVDCIRLGNALEEYDLAWLEDMRPDIDVDGLKEITAAIRTPTLNGEGIYLLDGFRRLIDERAVRIVQPDLATAGGLRETKRIADHADRQDMPSVFHFAGSPISFMANVHTAAATRSFMCLEHHALDIPWWEDLVTGLDHPLVEDGYVRVPERPGLGVDLNLDVIAEHLREPGLFEPTPEWDAPKLGYYVPPGPRVGE
ncbi:MAG TPA: mandelate racemase/muconate lactonizing enzyme family protein [Candidatus Dormibacteraeota bacterium]|nr:mandelate racemase/muconate lactonizing enzyme family protein [Candidatus Dormibacteraeota bacterium]